MCAALVFVRSLVASPFTILALQLLLKNDKWDAVKDSVTTGVDGSGWSVVREIFSFEAGRYGEHGVPRTVPWYQVVRKVRATVPELRA